MRVQRGLLLLCAVLANGAPPVSGFGDPSDDIPPASRAGSDVAVAIVVILATFAALFFPTILAIFYGITSRWANNPIAAPVPIPVGGDAPAGGEVAAIDAAALQQDHAGHALAPGQHADNEIRLQHAPNDTKIYINSVVNNFRPTLVAEVETVLACFAAPSDGVPVAADQELALQKFAVEKAIEIIRLKSDAEQKLFWQTITSGFARFGIMLANQAVELLGSASALLNAVVRQEEQAERVGFRNEFHARQTDAMMALVMSLCGYFLYQLSGWESFRQASASCPPPFLFWPWNSWSIWWKVPKFIWTVFSFLYCFSTQLGIIWASMALTGLAPLLLLFLRVNDRIFGNGVCRLADATAGAARRVADVVANGAVAGAVGPGVAAIGNIAAENRARRPPKGQHFLLDCVQDFAIPGSNRSMPVSKFLILMFSLGWILQNAVKALKGSSAMFITNWVAYAALQSWVSARAHAAIERGNFEGDEKNFIMSRMQWGSVVLGVAMAWLPLYFKS